MIQSDLAEIRRSRGYTQMDIAEKMQVSLNTVANWERTSRFRYPSDLSMLLRLYEVDRQTGQAVILRSFGDPEYYLETNE